MREITPENADGYLRQTGRVPEGRAVTVRALGWGVSNVVLRVDVGGMAPFVLKQARERLRTKMLWVSRLVRVWTERAAMGLLGRVLPEGAVPRVLFSDEPNYLFAMTCAPEGSAVWKEQLLAGRVDPGVARRAGEILGTVHRLTRDHPALSGRLEDTTVFDELRVDPFYRTIAGVHPEIAPAIDDVIASMSRPGRRGLVLGDFSPKNILVHDDGLTLVDFETAHAGDPAYDVGFFLSHLHLKEIRAESAGAPAKPYRKVFSTFHAAYQAAEGSLTVARPSGWSDAVRRHMFACILARVDGKSPVDYLDEPGRVRARALALRGFGAAAPGGTANAPASF
jgi:5-methylthioribose kinase